MRCAGVLARLQRGGGSRSPSSFEQAQIDFAYELSEAGGFAGRIRVLAEPHVDPSQRPHTHLRLLARRIVKDRDLDSVLEQCHADIVRAFTQ